ncbi:MAG: PAS domain S-box protein, partial [Chryseolinea sp.]
MNQKLKILHLEDLRTDAELVGRELKKSGLSCDIVVVDNEKDFTRELIEFSPDVILSDHSLPTFSSLGALKVLNEKGIGIPFILITSTTSEEIAVNVMKAGAWDYILKDRMQRLPSAIEHVMDKYNAHQAKTKAEYDLANAHQQLLFHIENSPLGFVEWDNLFNLKQWSPRTGEIFGWTAQEYQDLQKQGYNAVYEPDHPLAVQKAAELTSGVVIRNHFVNRANTKSGKVIWCEWFNSIYKNSDGKVMTIMSLVSDVTEKKLAEEKLKANEKRFRSLIENITDGIVVSDADSKILYQSPSVERILGYSQEKESNQSLKGYVHPDYLQSYSELFQSVLKNAGQPHPFEFPFLHKKGKYVWLEGIITNLIHDESVKGIVANYRDVTQRKMLNDVLKEYNDRHEIVSRATNDAIWDWDIEHDYEVWNHGTETIFGYSEREVDSSHNWWKEKLHPMDYERVNSEIKETFHRQAANWVSQYRYRCANG